MSLESVRERIARAWTARLTGLGYQAPRDLVLPGGEEFRALDVRPVRSRAGLRFYFDKGAVLDRTWTIADEVTRGATAKKTSGMEGATRFTPLELLRRLSEDRGPSGAGWYFNLPTSRRDVSGARKDRDFSLTRVETGVYELRRQDDAPDESSLKHVREHVDERTGEVRSFVDVPAAHDAWFEFQAASRTTATDGRRAGTRSQTWRQIPAVLRRIRDALGDRATFAERFAWVGYDEAEDTDTDPLLLERTLGGTPIGGFTRLSWERYHDLAPEEQALLHSGFESSAKSGAAVAATLGIEIQMVPPDAVAAAYRYVPPA